MKAMIFAAGFGTRLHPYTKILPKPLFTIADTPIIEIIINRLADAGFTELIINTHHLGAKIADYILSNHYPVKIDILYEPEILDTAGAIKNAAEFLGNDPFLVINSDIITDIDLKAVYRFHSSHSFPVTMVMHDYPRFNRVKIDKKGFIESFSADVPLDGEHILAYTGISVIDPEVIEFIPKNRAVGLVEIFEKLISLEKGIKAFFIEKAYWKDIGTPESYKEAVFETLAQSLFETSMTNIDVERLEGGGSDRKWYRLYAKGKKSVIASEDDINLNTESSQTNSFIRIGKHLYSKRISVPAIAAYDTMAGFVFSYDIGDIHLKNIVEKEKDIDRIISLYKKVIDSLILLCIKGRERFDIRWCFQTAYYDSMLIRDKECRYFTDSFLNGYLGFAYRYEDFAEEFETLAVRASDSACLGFMHRDMQSENIMIGEDKIYFIDFQSGRIGPLEYDLASLLIDPYVDFSENIRHILFDYAVKKLLSFAELDEDRFYRCFNSCLITRNLQILGAFGFLVSNGKKRFERYIPTALKSLICNLKNADMGRLLAIAEKIRI